MGKTKLKKYYVSFGQIHTHRVNGKTFDCDSLCEIESIDEEAAREIAFDMFGSEFFTTYNESHALAALQYFPRGIIPLIN